MKISVCCSGSKESLVKPSALSAYAKGKSNKKNSAFTLAEMMVVMLIMSIILAAMAPVMTTRSKADSSSPWRFSPNNSSDAYFGYGDSQIAMIGQPNKLETDDAAKLIINSSNFLMTQISFKRNNTNVGRLYLDTNNNLILGNSTLDKLTSGTHNVVIGLNNLLENTSGVSNIAIGDSALKSNTTGTSNTALGTCLGSNTTGNDNTALGDDSLVKNTTGSNNVAVGVDALTAATTASWNIAIGKNAYQNGTGGANTIIGGDAMSKYSGENNVAVGTNALWYGNGNGNVSIGANSNYKSESMTSFNNSTAVGFLSYALGENSVAVGYNASATQTSSVAIGDRANVATSYAVAVGYMSKAEGEGSGTALGGNASATNFFTTAIGRSANASGYYATAIGGGAKAPVSNTVALGRSAEASSTGATALGYEATASGSDSISIGNSSNVMRVGGIAIGNDARSGSTNSSVYGDYGIAIGYSAGTGNDYGVSIGYNSGNTNSGSNNIAIGKQACKNVTGSNKICIGANSGPTSGSEATNSEEMIYIGSKPKWGPIRGSGWADDAVLVVHNSTKTIGIGSRRGGMEAGPTVYINGNLVVRGYTYTVGRGDDNNETEPIGVLGNKNGSLGGDQVKWYSTSEPGDYWTSDRRLKYVGKESHSGLDKIRELKVYNYTYKKDKSKTPHVGVIAQDLQKVFPSAVKKGTDGFLTIRMEEMFYAMINAIKELDLKYQAQEKRINELEQRIEKLEAKIK